MTFTPRTTDQNSRIHGLAHQNGIDRDTLHDHAADITGGRTSKTSELSFDEANELIRRLGGEPLPANAALSVRSQQKARQKSGVKQIVSQGQLKKIGDLWFSRQGRTPAGLTSIMRSVIKHDEPRTTTEANKIIEAIKSMNKRPVKEAA